MLGDRVVFEGFRYIEIPSGAYSAGSGRVKHAYAAAPGGLEQRILTLDVTWPGSGGCLYFLSLGRRLQGVVTAGI